MLPKAVVDQLLRHSGVWNEFSHVENGNLHTAITSYQELVNLMYLAHEYGYEQALMDQRKEE